MRSIPLLGDMMAEEQAAWLRAFNQPQTHLTVVPFAEMDEQDRQAAEVAIIANPLPEQVAALPNLKWVQSLWAGIERVITDPALSHLPIVRMTDPGLGAVMAEAVLAWSLYLHRDMPAYAKAQAAKRWEPRLLKPACKRRIGLLGLGNLGAQAAGMLSRHGFAVSGWSRSPKHVADIETYHGNEGFKAVLSQSDILVVLLPLTPHTHGLLSTEMLGQLPKGAAIINFARGPIVDLPALLSALETGALSHAVLDVFDEEPLHPESPLWTHPDVTVLPHISAPTMVATAAPLVLSHLRHYFDTGEIPKAVDRVRGY